MDKRSWIQRKIYSREALVKECNAWRVAGKRIVFTNGCFDILHFGHLDLIAQAASQGNLLVVGLNTDASVKKLKGPERPVTQENDRAFQMASLLCVDAVVLFDEETPLELITALKPDVLVKGGDYNHSNIVGADFVKSNSGEVIIIPFVNGYSTTSIIDRIKHL